MLLWDIIRDFLVEYIFGGMTSQGDIFGGYVCSFLDTNQSFTDLHTGSSYIESNIYASVEAFNGYISIGDYLSTTATIIILVVLAFVVALGIRWLFRFLVSRFTKWGL